MKTTDSAMREKYREIGAEIIRIAHKFGINEIDLAGELGTLSQLNKDLASHSLAEARREDLRRVKYLLETYVWDGNIGDGLAKDGGHDYLIEIMENRKLLTKKVLNLLTGDNPEEGKV